MCFSESTDAEETLVNTKSIERTANNSHGGSNSLQPISVPMDHGFYLKKTPSISNSERSNERFLDDRTEDRKCRKKTPSYSNLTVDTGGLDGKDPLGAQDPIEPPQMGLRGRGASNPAASHHNHVDMEWAEAWEHHHKTVVLSF
ncbi:hypothetical protein SBOR_2857 [Sclerotinia borealis F-4128]|uniref:Uncharacterized protein n=1 Tax=Sclerotinia borealis (strain F-4128) TaxID=1432307 RepID=W9CL24_SCLBF|nr:hypothetical protein SBOR_2857 [Sclerotinia borealis F-4128]